jgi:hypothetical protein
MSKASTELQTPETAMKSKLNNTVIRKLITKEDFQTCLSIPEKTAIVYRIRIEEIEYDIYYTLSEFLTEVSAFMRYIQENPPQIYRPHETGRRRTKVDEREYNFVMFLFLLKIVEGESDSAEMSTPTRLGDVSLFDKKITALQALKEIYPEEHVNIVDDVTLEVPQIVIDNKLCTLTKYKEKKCSMMGGKTKRKSKKIMMKRKSKKIMMKRKSKKIMMKRKSKK